MKTEDLLLHIESSTEICSVCLSKGSKIIAFKNSIEAFVHTRKATLMIQSLFTDVGLKISELKAISISQGPGSYTGLRVGTSIAKGMAFGLDIPIIAVKTLKSLALASKTELRGVLYISMIDARRMEVYLSLYDDNLQAVLEDNPVILDENSFHQLFEKYNKIIFSGNGVAKFKEINNHKDFIFTKYGCDARHLVPLAIEKYLIKDFCHLESFTPNYIKPANVTKSKKKLI